MKILEDGKISENKKREVIFFLTTRNLLAVMCGQGRLRSSSGLARIGLARVGLVVVFRIVQGKFGLSSSLSTVGLVSRCGQGRFGLRLVNIRFGHGRFGLR